MAVVSIIALALAQATTPAAPPTPPAPSAAPVGAQAIQTTSQTFSACIGPKVAAVPATMTPEQGADMALAACKSEDAALRNAVEAMLTSLPADQQAMGRQQLDMGMSQARIQIAEAIRQKRAAPTVPAAPASPAK